MTWNYIGTFVNMGIGVIMIPILLIYLDSETLGVWYVMQSFSTIANLFTFGFTPVFARNVAYSWNGASKLSKSGKDKIHPNKGKINYQLLKEVLCASRMIYLMLSVLAVGVIGIFGTIHIWNIAEAIMTASIKVSWGFFLGAIFLNIYYGYYHSYIVGIGLIKEANQILVVSSAVRLALMVMLMQIGWGILGGAIAYFVYGMVYRIFCKKTFYNVKELKYNKKMFQGIKVSTKQIKENISIIWYNAWRDGIVSVANYLQTQASTLICSGFLTLSQTATYSLTIQLITMISNIAQSIQNAYVPVMQGAFIQGDRNLLKKTHAFCLSCYTLVYILGVVGFLLIGVPIVSWLKPDVDISRFFLFVYAIYQFMITWRNCYGTYLSCTNRVIYWKSYILTGFASVFTYSLLLIYTDFGIWGIVITSIFAEGVYNFWKWTDLVNKELDFKIRDCFKVGKEEICILLKS